MIRIRQISLRSPSLKMNSKISLILFGFLVTLAVLAAAENSEENTLSEEVASSRLARSADADAGRRKNKSSKKNKKKSRKAAKKAAKKAKKALHFPIFAVSKRKLHLEEEFEQGGTERPLGP